MRRCMVVVAGGRGGGGGWGGNPVPNGNSSSGGSSGSDPVCPVPQSRGPGRLLPRMTCTAGGRCVQGNIHRVGRRARETAVDLVTKPLTLIGFQSRRRGNAGSAGASDEEGGGGDGRALLQAMRQSSPPQYKPQQPGHAGQVRPPSP